MDDKIENMNSSVSQSFFWKFLERFGVTGIQFVLQLVLARLLDPEHYGVLAIMVIFTSLANVFVQSGFNTALIQNKDVSEEDYSSVLWVSLLIAAVLYGVIFLTAPLIAAFYAMPGIIAPLRILALMLFPGALNSVQLAKTSREMNFRTVFLSSICSTTVSGIFGIVLAYLGFGLWALVAQTLTNTLITCLVMRFTVPLKIRFCCDLGRIRTLFSFGWKLLASSLLDTFYDDLYSLVIGKKFSSGILGFYSRGTQFPDCIIDIIDGTVNSVMLPALSAQQEDQDGLTGMMRRSMMVSAYVVLPMMIGLAAVAEPLITLLLTEKWLPCVPYMQLYCIACGVDPVHTCNLQAINAIGRSDVFLKLEIVKKIYFTVILAVIIIFFDSPVAIAGTCILDAIICWIINAFPSKKLLNYSIWEQICDLVPSMLITAVMGIVVMCVGLLELAPLHLLVIQVAVGVAVYALLSWVVKPVPFLLILDAARAYLQKKKENNC